MNKFPTWHFTTNFHLLELNTNNLTTGLCKYVLNFFEVAIFKGRYHLRLGLSTGMIYICFNNKKKKARSYFLHGLLH